MIKQLENLVIAGGKLNGKKGPGRPRTSYLTSPRKWLDPTANQKPLIN